VCVRVSACGWLWDFVCVCVHFCAYVCKLAQVCERMCVCMWVCECVHVWSHACERQRVRERVCVLVLSLRLHTYLHEHTFFFTLLNVILTHMHACHALVGFTLSSMHMHNDFVVSLFFLLAFSAPFSYLFPFACVKMRVFTFEWMCVHMCIQICAYVHACPCVVVSVQERKSETENVGEIVFYISQLAYTQRGVWKRSCECNVVHANASKSRIITNNINTHYLSCYICVCECARDRERQRDSEQQCECVLCLSACTLYAKTFTHTAAFSNFSH